MPVTSNQVNPMSTFLHVGCGQKRKPQTTRGFNTAQWEELRLDVNPACEPDITGTMTEMSTVGNASVDAIFSSHNIEHLYPHEVPVALAEFRRVLKPHGFVVITCPDLGSVARLIAEDKLTETAYTSPAGPITPLDILYGHRTSLANGNIYMAHRCGFTRKVLTETLKAGGFASVAAMGRAHPFYDLWAVASVDLLQREEIIELAGQHFPAAQKTDSKSS